MNHFDLVVAASCILACVEAPGIKTCQQTSDCPQGSVCSQHICQLAPDSANATFNVTTPINGQQVAMTNTSLTKGKPGNIATATLVGGSTYSWSVAGAGAVITAGSQSNQVTFTAGTGSSMQLQCMVTNLSGVSDTKSVTIAVIPAAAIESLVSNPTRIPLGTSTIITATFSGGVGNLDQGVGPVTSGTGVTASPMLPTTYILTVTNAAGDGVNAQTTVSVSNIFSNASPLLSPRAEATATLLPTGKVLIAGGLVDTFVSRALSSAELYDPLGNAGAGNFSSTGTLGVARFGATATLLRNGKVLIVGGFDGTLAELYDPAGNAGAGSFSTTGSLANSRWSGATATLLPNGKVLIAGGPPRFNAPESASAELYDPAGNGGTGRFSATGSLNTPRSGATATLLPNGKVLIAGGLNNGVVLASTEIYDPTGNGGAGTFSSTASLLTSRHDAVATLLPSGKVLIAGGRGSFGMQALASAELYDPTGSAGAGSFTSTGSLVAARHAATAALLPNGKVLIAGGVGSQGGIVASAELYDPAGNGGVGTFSSTGSMGTRRARATATVLPNGKVLLGGGSSGSNESNLTSTELYDPAGIGDPGSFSSTGNLVGARSAAMATRLATGKVLIAGGQSSSGPPLASAELYDPGGNGGVGSFGVTGGLATARSGGTATLLPNGKVLVAGGFNSLAGTYLASAELYDPAVGTFSSTGSLAAPRSGATATLLPNGKILVAGGSNNINGTLVTAELYDPAGSASAGSFTSTGSLAVARAGATATLLPNGKVLIAGGQVGGSPASAELYDPAGNSGVGSFSATGGLIAARPGATATLLPNGNVLIAGGRGSGGAPLASAELYDAAGNGAGSFKSTGSLIAARYDATATLLPNGKVLIAGGGGSGGLLASVELFDPAGNAGVGTFSTTSVLAVARSLATATLLSNGKVLVAGGSGTIIAALASAELYGLQ